MKIFKLKDMHSGWFIGNFQPSVFKTNDVEVAIKKYREGDYENAHYHKLATEFTVIVSGSVKMNDEIYTEGDVIVIEPYESTDFRAMTDVITTVVKLPGANNDKYLLNND
jgi:hypothetical protein